MFSSDFDGRNCLREGNMIDWKGLMRIPIPIRKSIALLIILTTLSPLPSEDMYGEGIFHSLDELPSMQFDSTTMGSVESLLKDKYEYEKSPKDTEVTALPLLNSTGEYIIRETSELQDDIDGVKVSSSLLEKTLVRNARNAGTPIDTLSIRKASPDKEAKAKKRFYRDHRQDENNPRVKVLTFDFGVEGTHLIFSKPVELSIAADAIPEGSTVSLYVLHA